jgi:hypothetical protein
MMKKEKTIFLKFPQNISSREKFLEIVMNAVQSPSAIYRFRGEGVEIKLKGDPISIKRSIDSIKRALLEFQYQQQSQQDKTIVNKYFVAKILNVPVPIEAFKKYLELEGIAFYEEDNLVIDAGIDELRKKAYELYNRLMEARKILSGKAASEVIAIASMILDIDVSETIRIAIERKILRRENDETFLAMEKNHALQKLLET